MIESPKTNGSSTNDQQPQPKRKLAHDLKDSSILRSKDVELNESVTFEDLLLAPETIQGLKACGYERPSPIQLEAIPLGRCGFDLVVQSKSGTGKTCLFALVALEALQSNPSSCTQTLIIAPTREIAIQIHEVISQIGCAYKQLRCALCIGGNWVKQDITTLSKACQIVIGTPGRIVHLIGDEILKTSQIELFILDEADKLMDEKFKKQIDSIYSKLPNDKQMIVTSATYPDGLSKFLEKYMRDSKSIRLGIELFPDAIQQYFVESKPGGSKKLDRVNKTITLKALINQEQFTKCIVFTNSQAQAQKICKDLNEDSEFINRHGTVNYINGELEQPAREAVFNRFRNSTQRILISTDVLGRGADIDDIEVVINYDIPMIDNGTTYLHRIGRSGRFGKSGRAISIVTSNGESDSSLGLANSRERTELSVLMSNIKDKNRIKKLELL